MKLVKDENVTIFHISIHISLNIGPRILNPYTTEYPFPSAVHIYWLLIKTLTPLADPRTMELGRAVFKLPE